MALAFRWSERKVAILLPANPSEETLAELTSAWSNTLHNVEDLAQVFISFEDVIEPTGRFWYGMGSVCSELQMPFKLFIPAGHPHSKRWMLSIIGRNEGLGAGDFVEELPADLQPKVVKQENEPAW